MPIFTDSEGNRTPVLVNKTPLLFRGSEKNFRHKELVLIDPFDPSKNIVRNCVALQDDWVQQTIPNSNLVYHSRVDDGCCYVVDESNLGMVSPFPLN